MATPYGQERRKKNVAWHPGPGVSSALGEACLSGSLSSWTRCRRNSPRTLRMTPSCRRRRNRSARRICGPAYCCISRTLGTASLRKAATPQSHAGISYTRIRRSASMYSPISKKWSGIRDSNPRLSAWEADTLPAELIPPESAILYLLGASFARKKGGRK